MVKIPPSKIDEELKKQEDEVYGTDYIDSDPDKFKDTEEMVKDVTGNEPDPEDDGFEIAEEVEKDEEAIAAGADNPTDEDLEEEEEE